LLNITNSQLPKARTHYEAFPSLPAFSFAIFSSG